MSIYIFLTIIVCFLMCFVLLNRKALIIPFVVLAIFAGLRYNVGIDYKTYTQIYDWGSEGFNTTSEPFFIYIIKLCVFLGGNVQLMFALLALLTNYFVYKFIYQNSVNVFISFFLYFSILSFYLYTFNATRQWAACSVFLFSFHFLHKKKYLIFIAINIIGALFLHFSLIFIIPILIGCTFVLSKKMQLFLVVSTLLIAFSVKVLLSNSVYAGYASDDIEFDSSVDMKIYIFLFLNILIHFFYKNKINNFYERLIFNINYISALLLIMTIIQGSGTFVLILKRFHNYFLAMYLIIIPYLMVNLSETTRKLLNMMLIVMLPTLFLITVYYLGKTLVLIPYEFNFNLFGE